MESVKSNVTISDSELDRVFLQDTYKIQDNVSYNLARCAEIFPRSTRNQLKNYMVRNPYIRGFNTGLLTAMLHIKHSEDYVLIDKFNRTRRSDNDDTYFDRNWMDDQLFLSRIRSNVTFGEKISRDTVNTLVMGSSNESSYVTLSPELKVPDSGVDIDVMLEIKDMRILGFKKKTPNIIINPDRQLPVYVGLTIIDGDSRQTLESNKFIASIFVKEDALPFQESPPCVSGPAIRKFYTDLDQIDQIFCFKVIDGTQYLNDWETRKSCWPPESIKDQVRKSTVYVVPTGSRQNPHHWRLSFSAAEIILFANIGTVERKIYKLTKLILKTVSKVPSYFLKTVLFWFLEETAEFRMKPTRVVDLCIGLLRHLLMFCCKRNLPHFFIQSHNLLAETNSDMIRLYCKQISRATKQFFQIAVDTIFARTTISEYVQLFSVSKMMVQEQFIALVIQMIMKLYRDTITHGLMIIHAKIEYFTLEDSSCTLEMNFRMAWIKIREVMTYIPTVIRAVWSLIFQRDVPLENIFISLWYEVFCKMFDRYMHLRDPSKLIAMCLLFYVALDDIIKMWADKLLPENQSTCPFIFIQLKLTDFAYAMMHHMYSREDINFSPFTEGLLKSAFTHFYILQDHKVITTQWLEETMDDFLEVVNVASVVFSDVYLHIHSFFGDKNSHEQGNTVLQSLVPEYDPLYWNSTFKLAMTGLRVFKSESSSKDKIEMLGYIQRYQLLFYALFLLREKESPEICCSILTHLLDESPLDEFFVFRHFQKVLFLSLPQIYRLFGEFSYDEEFSHLSINVHFLCRSLLKQCEFTHFLPVS